MAEDTDELEGRTRARRFDAPLFGRGSAAQSLIAADAQDKDDTEVDQDDPAEQLPKPPPLELDDRAVTAAFLAFRGYTKREIHCILTGPGGCDISDKDDGGQA